MASPDSVSSTVVILGTGGTIAGAAASATDNVGYSAAQLGVQTLVDAVPALRGLPLEAEQVAQIDSKDMSHALWLRLAQRCEAHLARAEVSGIVVTHGTDTLEETAYFLHRVLAPRKPLVLTAAMRPATSLQADGPQNLLDAVTVALAGSGAGGVLVAVAGAVHAAADVRKLHTRRLDAFGSGDAGPLARVEEGRLRVLRPWPSGQALGLAALGGEVGDWPRVEIVFNHAGADGRIVDLLVQAGVQGLIAAGTGNATLSAPVQAALQRAAESGVVVRRTTRCPLGPVIDAPPSGAAAPARFPAFGGLSPWAARVELLLELLAARRRT